MTDDALLSTPARIASPESIGWHEGRMDEPDPSQATGHYGAGYGDPQRHFGTQPQGQAGQDEHHHHYRRLRAEHERQLDEDYAAYRRHRFTSEFERWRNGRQETIAPRDDSPLESLGRAVSETVTGTQDPDLHTDTAGSRHAAAHDPSSHDRQHGGTERFFERS
jgi:hypothetical protein